MKTARDIFHEIRPYHCMPVTDDDGDLVFTSHGIDCEELYEWSKARDREVRAAALREVNEYLTGYSGFLEKMGFREAANGVESVCCVFEAAAASGNLIAVEAAKP